MKTKINIPVLFFAFGLFNLLFLIDTILTDKSEHFYIFSIRTSKTLNIMYYIVFSAILIGAGIFYHKLNNIKKR